MNARCEVLVVVRIQVEFFCIVKPCSVMVGYQHFRGPCCLYVQVEVTGNGKNGNR
jgi:hypothetical protein